MNETDFEALAGAALSKIEQALEASGVDADFELKAGGVLEIEFADGSKMVVNRHAAAREIWVAARAGGFHFRWMAAPGATRATARNCSPRCRKIVSTQAARRCCCALRSRRFGGLEQLRRLDRRRRLEHLGGRYRLLVEYSGTSFGAPLGAGPGLSPGMVITAR